MPEELEAPVEMPVEGPVGVLVLDHISVRPSRSNDRIKDIDMDAPPSPSSLPSLVLAQELRESDSTTSFGALSCDQLAQKVVLYTSRASAPFCCAETCQSKASSAEEISAQCTMFSER